MENKDFALASNKFLYYLMNYTFIRIHWQIFGVDYSGLLPEWFKAFPEDKIAHLVNKFQNSLDKDRVSFFFEVYANIDGELRYQLLSWINNTYPFKGSFGISIPELEED